MAKKKPSSSSYIYLVLERDLGIKCDQESTVRMIIIQLTGTVW